MKRHALNAMSAGGFLWLACLSWHGDTGAQALLALAGAIWTLAIGRTWWIWSRTAHRPHCDLDWGTEVWKYRANDPGRRGLLFDLLWGMAGWAPFGAKMIWRGEKAYMARIYLVPWWCPRQVFLHRIFMSDDAIHDHPTAWSLSLILGVGYREVRAARALRCAFGAGVANDFELEKTSAFKRWFNYIPAGAFHALDLTKGPTWTIFLCGARDREWGFLSEDGTYTAAGDVQRIAQRRAETAARASDASHAGVLAAVRAVPGVTGAWWRHEAPDGGHLIYEAPAPVLAVKLTVDLARPAGASVRITWSPIGSTPAGSVLP